jgi:hypothetical protein
VGVRGVWESPKISSDLAVGESILYVDGGMYNDVIVIHSTVYMRKVAEW